MLRFPFLRSLLPKRASTISSPATPRTLATTPRTLATTPRTLTTTRTLATSPTPAVAMALTTRDPNTLANYGHWRTRHVTAELKIDFEAKCLRGSVELQLESMTDRGSDEIVLDSSFLDIRSVTLDGGSEPPQWEVGARVEPYGAPLRVRVPGGAAEGARVRVGVELATTDKCTALQWLTPVQTSDGKHPYMYSQCQAIHARSLFPCQDTPDVKATVSFRIASPLAVVASGILEGEPEAVPGGGAADKLYRFEQRIPIPVYLFALASGDIVTAEIGPRSLVATSPDKIAAARWEFERDVEGYMQAVEKLVFPYRWQQFNVLVLPPGFPYGGMENPVYTFATPTLVSGDRENVYVLAHELSHGWSGNLVTNCSWEHFWLNEGWTTYLERRLGAVLHGESNFDFSAIIGWKALEDSVAIHGSDHEFTKLVIDHKGIDPDDAFSTVPYEKGFHLLYYLDRLVGRADFDKFIPHYFAKWAGKSLDSFEFRQTFLDFFDEHGDEEVKEKIAAIDWDDKFYAPGLPPKPDFDTSLVDECYALAEKWESSDFEPHPRDLASFGGNQKLVFLEKLQGVETPLPAERARLLGAVYDLERSQNTDLKSAYYLIALRSEDKASYAGVAEMLGQVGRMKYVRPLFRALNKADAELARTTFKVHESFYHPICRAMVAKQLGVE